jgi:hypothetical protein
MMLQLKVTAIAAWGQNTHFQDAPQAMLSAQPASAQGIGRQLAETQAINHRGVDSPGRGQPAKLIMLWLLPKRSILI